MTADTRRRPDRVQITACARPATHHAARARLCIHHAARAGLCTHRAGRTESSTDPAGPSTDRAGLSAGGMIRATGELAYEICAAHRHLFAHGEQLDLRHLAPLRRLIGTARGHA